MFLLTRHWYKGRDSRKCPKDGAFSMPEITVHLSLCLIIMVGLLLPVTVVECMDKLIGLMLYTDPLWEWRLRSFLSKASAWEDVWESVGFSKGYCSSVCRDRVRGVDLNPSHALSWRQFIHFLLLITQILHAHYLKIQTQWTGSGTLKPLYTLWWDCRTVAIWVVTVLEAAFPTLHHLHG